MAHILSIKTIFSTRTLGCAIAGIALFTAASASTTHAQQTLLQVMTTAPIVQHDYDALFNQMYQSPANLDVSFKFAEQAVSRGDYEAAIGALERMLFFNPNLPRVKLELGVLYLKLGSFELARSYFLEAIKGPVPDEIRGQVNAYLAQIDRRMSVYDYSVFAQAGLRYQTNANVGPNDLLVRALGQDAILGSNFGKRPDWNSFQTVAASVGYKLNMRGDALEASLLALGSQQFRLSQFNLGLVELIAGPRIAIGQNASFKFYGIGDMVWLGDANYFNAAGGGVSARSTIGELGFIEAFVEGRHRSFFDSVNFPTASEQTGDFLSSGVVTDLRLTSQLRGVVRAGYDENQAIFAYNSYKRYSIDLAFPFAFTLPIFGQLHQFVVAPTLGYSWSNYAAPNAIIDPTMLRNDSEQRYGAIFDAQIYDNVGLRTQLQYSKIDSSLPILRMA
jgi:tetratricopeptide (TPR) repeat protein